MNHLTTLTALGLMAGVACGDVLVDFDELITPGPDYVSGAGFVSKRVAFTGGQYFGWTYSDVNDTTTPGFLNQYAAYTGVDVEGDGNYAIASGGWGYINLPADQTAVSASITNTTYAALAMRDGNLVATAFGSDPQGTDLFTVTLNGYSGANGTGALTGSTAAITLGSYTAVDGLFILDTWQAIDLTVVGDARSIGLSFSSTDVGEFGINTPTYIALDNLQLVPEPSSLAGLMLVGLAAVTRRSR
ncbi:DUF4465 domain-containing protein [Mucisphaera calidilacus]|uniref:PEP-CTERM protein-sorting domain-containing protein n=1 Tax=Mucisphaera calidilacus TaxID=2527982 RepID=A0A518BTS0_9BACT|nr:DUF4465 domain-containing protein [Mucisphaera calidilacus]QDU70382.1 hypothetical protein Pan265_02080 [Mucisphaera calidilacus]